MIRTLLSMLNDEKLRTRIAESTNGLCKAYSDVMNNLNSKFEEDGDNYVFVLNVPNGTTSADINVEYDDETNMVTVEVSRKSGNFSSKMSFSETLPCDADIDTMKATVVNGVFTIVVDKLPEAEPETVDEANVDPITVEVKRKNHK